MSNPLNTSSLKLTKEEKKNLNRLSPKPGIKGTVEQKIAKVKDL